MDILKKDKLMRYRDLPRLEKYINELYDLEPEIIITITEVWHHKSTLSEIRVFNHWAMSDEGDIERVEYANAPMLSLRTPVTKEDFKLMETLLKGFLINTINNIKQFYKDI